MRKSFHSKRSLFISTCLLLVSGFFAIHYSATTQAASWILSGGANWDTTNFINQDFWNGTPNTGDIIMALYGTGDEGTIYTQNWSGYSATSCLQAGMTVLETNTLPQNLSANTIYVLDTPEIILTGTTNMANCSTVISKNASGTIFFSTGSLLSPFSISNKHEVIIDNIIVDGTSDGIGGSHATTSYGIYIGSSSNTTVAHIQSYNNGNGIGLVLANNSTIAHTQAYRNTNVGLYLQNNSNNNTLVDSVAYGNINGIYITASSNANTVDNISSYNNSNHGININNVAYTIIKNSFSYNNIQYGIYVNSGAKNTINNVQSYNNERGIDIVSNSSYTSINNAQFYNNNNVGIRMQNSIGTVINHSQSYNNSVGIFAILSSTNNVFNTVQLYNNSAYGLHLDDTSSGQIYGTNTIFANGVINLSIATGSLLSGYASDALVNGLSRDNGEILTTGKLSWNSMTNPISMSGNYLLSWSGSWSSLPLKKAGYSGQITQGYSYGSGILFQQQPVIWSGTTELISSGTYDTTKYIGSDIIKAPGELLGLPTITSGLNFIITRNSFVRFVSNYSLFGDIVSWKINQTIGTTTGITLLTGDGQKRVVTQLFGTPYFATHFENTTLLDQTGPTFIFNNAGGWECHTAANLTINTVVDSGAGIPVNPYSFDNGSTWTNNPTIVVPPQQPGAQIRTGRVKDAIGNITYKTAVYTFSDAPPVGDDFTGNSNVGYLSRTANWRTGANVREGWCGSVDITHSGMISQGTKGTCSVSGDTITYTPSINQIGNDSCVLQVKDNENTTKNISIYWKNIDTTISCLSNWNNDNFITGAFWNNNPTPGNIVCALYGSGSGDATAYTQNWSGRDTTQCNVNTFTIIETDNVPQTLLANTIYVLSGTNAITTGATTMANCSAVISKNTSGTTFFTTGYINGGLFTLSNKQHVILDNVNINGNDDGIGGTHNKNNYGVYGLSTSKNITLNNLTIYNNLYGIYMNSLSYTTIANTTLSTNTNNGLFFQSTTNSSLQNISAQNNNVGIQISSASNNNTLRDIETMDNSTHGIYVVGASNNSISNIVSHNNGSQGISLDTASNNTIDNAQAYNNNHNGIYFQASSNNSINNCQSYNNTNGIFLTFSSNNTINNSQSYNNQYGIYFQSSSNNNINNSQSYNNSNGIWSTSSSNNTINNVQSYNSKYGIYFFSSSNNFIRNSQFYNNQNGIYLDANSTSNTYYGTISLFVNDNNVSGIPSNLSTGYASDALVQGLGRTNGSLITSGTMSRDYIINPINTSSNYLLPWSGSWSNIRGQQSLYFGTTTNKYSYGSGILLQQQPVIWSGTTELISSGTYDTTKYIGSDIIKAPGELLGLPTITSGLNFIITRNSFVRFVSSYSLFGDIVSWKINQTIGTTTGITLLTGDGQKRVVTQLFGTPYFATHFESDTFLDQTPPTQVSLISPLSGSIFTTTNINLQRSGSTDTGAGISGYRLEVKDTSGNLISNVFTPGTSVGLSAIPDGTYTRKVYAIDNVGNTGVWSTTWNFTIDTLVCSTLWNNDNFISGAFWAITPAKKCVIEALYGSPTDTSTAYTENWSGYSATSCLSGNMDVVYTGNLDTNTLADNTIYVVTGAISAATTTINMANCSAIISNNSGGTTLYSTQQLSYSGSIYGYNKHATIVDNISINGSGGGPVPTHTINYNGIRYDGSNNNTLHKIKAYNFSLYGLYVASGSQYTTLQDIETYTNLYGVYFSGAAYTRAKNTVTYNNLHGIFVVNSTNTYITTISSYNNTENGIYFYATSNNTLNNAQTYNNKLNGISENNGAYNTTINNCQSYNNGNVGIFIFSGNNNTINNCQSYNNGYGFAIMTTGNQVNTIQAYNNKFNDMYIAPTAFNNYYYGNNKAFINAGISPSTFAPGASTNYPGLGRSTGLLITTGNISRDYMTNPRNASGNYLLSWSGSWTGIRGTGNFSVQLPLYYSYGSGILRQIQPVLWNGSTLINSGTYEATKYIGSDTVNVSGELLGLPAATSGLNFTVTGDSTNGLIHNYSLFGDITNFRNMLGVGTATGINLTSGDGQKRVVTQLFGNNYFATHFENDSFLDQTKPTFTINNATGLESTTGLLMITIAADTGVGLSLTPYSWSDDGINRGARTGNVSATRISHEPTTKTLRVKVRDAVDNIRTGSALFTWTNTGPVNTTINNNGPTTQGNTITWTGAALDTGTTLSYRWYSGYDCLSNFLSSGTTNTITGMLSLPGVLVRSLRVFDAQGSGGACVTSTGTWTNISPTAQEVTTSGYEFTSLTLTGNAIGNEPLTYQWYSNNVCTALLSTGQAYTPPVQQEPTTVYYYYQAFDSYGGVSACTTGTSIWKNVAPTANNFQHTGIEGDELFFTASGYDPGGTVFTYQRYSGDSCSGHPIGMNELFSYTSDIAGIYVRSYQILDAQASPLLIEPDPQGISNCAVATGIWNDITPPTAIITYSPTSGVWTSGAVLATITGFSEPISGLNVSGYTFTENGSFVFTFFDLAGNTGSVTATVDWIDSIAPSQLTLVSPLSGMIVTTGNINLVRSSAVDTGSGISGYLFEINGSGYNSTGITFATGISLSGLLDGTYTRKIYARDSVGHTSLLSDVWGFSVSSSCTLPRGGTIAHGQHIVAYQTNTVACGTTCASEIRTCSHGTLGGTFSAASCSVNSCGGGGGGTTTVQQDDCTLPSTFACANSSGKDYSASYYDHTCCASPVQTGHAAATSCDVSDSPYTSEITAAFQRAFTKQITNKCPITSAHLDNNITRIEAAKMMSIFAMEVLGRTPNTKKLGCTGYNDIGTLSQEMNLFATTACQLGIMGLHADGKTPKPSFDPQDFIDRAQFGTMLSRMLYDGQYNLSASEGTTHTRYEKHLQALKKEKIITNITNPLILEKRSWVLLMLHRVDSGDVVVKYRIITAIRKSIFALFSSIW